MLCWQHRLRPTTHSSPELVLPVPRPRGAPCPRLEPPGSQGHSQQPRWLSCCLADLEAGAAPRERPLCHLAWHFDTFPPPPPVLHNHTRCPHSDQRALAALMVAVNEASRTQPITTELARSFGQIPAPVAGVGQVGLRLSPVLMNK